MQSLFSPDPKLEQLPAMNFDCKFSSGTRLPAKIMIAKNSIMKKRKSPPNKIEWYPDEIVFLLKEFHNYTNPELLEFINSRRSKKIKITALRSKCYELGLKHEDRPDFWSDRETNFLLNNYKKLGNIEICERLNNYKNRTRFFTPKIIWKKMKLLKIKRTPRQLQKIKKKNVEKGCYRNYSRENFPQYRKEGEKWLRKQGKRKYWFIKTDGQIQFLHIYLYTTKIGAILPGNVVSFKDGDTTNCEIENLYQCKRGKHGGYIKKEHTGEDVFLEKEKAYYKRKFYPQTVSIPSYSPAAQL